MRFILIDRVTEHQPGQRVVGLKNVSASEDVFTDHFPSAPLFPGSLILESMAQLGGFLVEHALRGDDLGCNAVLAQVDKAKFHLPVRPGDQLVLQCLLRSTLSGAAQVDAEATVDGHRVARARLIFTLQRVDLPAVRQQRQELYRQWTRGLQSEPPTPS